MSRMSNKQDEKMLKSKLKKRDFPKLFSPPTEEIAIAIYQLNPLEECFEELELDSGIRKLDLLNPDLTLLFVDRENKRNWMWFGKEVNQFCRFVASRAAAEISHKAGKEMKLRTTTVDQRESVDSYPFEFVKMLGVTKEELQEDHYEFLSPIERLIEWITRTGINGDRKQYTPQEILRVIEEFSRN